MTAEIKDFYTRNTRQYYYDLFNGNPKNIRILFLTSATTVVVQYCTRDFMKCYQQFGYTCDISIEKSELTLAYIGSRFEKILEFKPDIIFQINFFRQDYEMLPENVIFVSWVQDSIVQIASDSFAKNIGKNDYILVHTKLYLDQMVKKDSLKRNCFSKQLHWIIQFLDHTN